MAGQRSLDNDETINFSWMKILIIVIDHDPHLLPQKKGRNNLPLCDQNIIHKNHSIVMFRYHYAVGKISFI